MKKRTKTSLPLKLIRPICSLALLGVCFYIFLFGLNLAVMATVALATATLATPIVLEGGSVIEMIVGVIEAFVEGVMIVVDCLVHLISGLFS